MKIKQTFSLFVCTSLLLPGALWARDAAAIKAPLHGTGLPDATGLAVAKLGGAQSELVLQTRRLAPSHAYDVEIAGIVEGSMTSDKNGRASLRFRTPARGQSLALDFDPRGELLRVLDAGTSVLEGVISGTGEDARSVVSEGAELEPGDDSPRSHGHASFAIAPSGRSVFRVDVSGVDDSPLHVFVDGVERGEMHHRGRMASAVFSSQPPNANMAQLDFDPRGSAVDVLKDDGSSVFSGRMEARVRGVNMATPSVNVIALPAAAAAGQGTASARLRIDERARKHFSVEIENVPAGSYDLLADGVNVGAITVAPVTNGTAGEVEFTTGDDDPHELPLTFDPVGKTLTVQQSGTVFFEGPFNPNVSGVGAPAPEPPSQLQESLTSTGLDTDATARARYRVDDQGRHKFSVEIEKVPAGAYQLVVAGVVRGTIMARMQTGTGQVVGEIEFATRTRSTTRESTSGGGGKGGGGMDDPGGTSGGGTDDAINGHELPLTFDPRGQTIEVRSDAGTFFSHLFGTGSAGDAATPAPTFDEEVALLSTGAVAGHAKADLRRREDGSLRFQVELEDAPLGAYDLLVDGVAHGTLNVVTTDRGTRGEIEFESAPEAGEKLLDFAVAGKEIDLAQGGVVLFGRVFPAQ